MKKRMIIVAIIVILILVLEISGIIPKQIGIIYGTWYMNKNFPEWQLKFVNIEYAKYFGDYSITFIDKNGNRRGCLIGPKYFPVFMGQGIFGMTEEYSQEFSK